MPQVPGTKVWLRQVELDTLCHKVEATVPMGRLIVVYEYALKNVRHARQALSNTKRVSKFVIWYWFNRGHFGGLDLNKFNDAMKRGDVWTRA